MLELITYFTNGIYEKLSDILESNQTFIVRN